jgi:hypothetical protein
MNDELLERVKVQYDELIKWIGEVEKLKAPKDNKLLAQCAEMKKKAKLLKKVIDFSKPPPEQK